MLPDGAEPDGFFFVFFIFCFVFLAEWLMTSQFHKRCKLWLLNQDMLLVIRWW